MDSQGQLFLSRMSSLSHNYSSSFSLCAKFSAAFSVPLSPNFNVLERFEAKVTIFPSHRHATDICCIVFQVSLFWYHICGISSSKASYPTPQEFCRSNVLREPFTYLCPIHASPITCSAFLVILGLWENICGSKHAETVVVSILLTTLKQTRRSATCSKL